MFLYLGKNRKNKNENFNFNIFTSWQKLRLLLTDWPHQYTGTKNHWGHSEKASDDDGVVEGGPSYSLRHSPKQSPSKSPSKTLPNRLPKPKRFPRNPEANSKGFCMCLEYIFQHTRLRKPLFLDDLTQDWFWQHLFGFLLRVNLRGLMTQGVLVIVM